MAPQPMLLMKSTGLVMLGAVGNLDAVLAQRNFSTFTHLRRKSNSRGLISSFINKIWNAIWAVKISLSHSNKPLMGRHITKFQHDQCVPCCVLEHLESDRVCEIPHSVGHIRVHDSTLRRYNFSVDLSFFTFMATSKTTLNALRLNWYIGLILFRSLRIK